MSAATAIVHQLLEDNEDAKADLMAQPDPVIFDHWELYFNVLNAEGEYDDSGKSVFFRTYAGERPFEVGKHVHLDSPLGRHLFKLAMGDAQVPGEHIDDAAYLLCVEPDDFNFVTQYEDESAIAPKGKTTL